MGGFNLVSVAYSYTDDLVGEVIYRPVSLVNPICNAVRPNSTEPCWQISPNTTTRFVAFVGSCCKLCDDDCGVLKPSWATAVPYLYGGWVAFGNQTCNSWTLNSNTPDRLSTDIHTGNLCSMYDGGASYTGDGPWYWEVFADTYSTEVTAADLALPATCENAQPCF